MMAARSASVLRAIMVALLPGPLPPPSAARAIWRALAVRFSICELDADSLRSSTDENGIPQPADSASKAAISPHTSSALARRSSDTTGSSWEMRAGIAYLKAPLFASRWRWLIIGSLGVQWDSR